MTSIHSETMAHPHARSIGKSLKFRYADLIKATCAKYKITYDDLFSRKRGTVRTNARREIAEHMAAEGHSELRIAYMLERDRSTITTLLKRRKSQCVPKPTQDDQ